MLTASRLRKLLAYNRTTGLFRWKVRLSNRTRVGAIAGCDDGKGYIRIQIGRKLYAASRLAVLHTTGRMPASDVAFRNGNTLDTRYRNLRVA